MDPPDDRHVIRVATVEDDLRYRASLETLLRRSPGFTLAGSFPSAEAMLGEIARGTTARRRCPWDVVLMDLELPGASGLEATRELKRRHPEVRVLVLTVFEEPATVLEAICAGADGYVLKHTPPRQLLEQLGSIVSGGAPLTSGIARTVLALLRATAETGGSAAAPSRLRLTSREQEVLRGLVDGLAYKQVAARLGVSLDTVRTYVRSIYSKLQVHSVAEAVGRALRERIL